MAAGGDSESMCCAWRRVLHRIGLIFAPFSSSAEDILRCGVGFVNRIWEVVDLNLVYRGGCGARRRFQHVWAARGGTCRGGF